MSAIFERTFIARPEHIDELGHVNNAVWVQWIQDVAVEHWDKVADPKHKLAYFWVVVRHEIDYKAPAFEGERLLARTWVGEPAGATWERFIEIRRPEGDKLLARGRSVYAALDKATGRPRRVDSQLREPFANPAT